MPDRYAASLTGGGGLTFAFFVKVGRRGRRSRFFLRARVSRLEKLRRPSVLLSESRPPIPPIYSALYNSKHDIGLDEAEESWRKPSANIVVFY
jgi:hypothetical protein